MLTERLDEQTFHLMMMGFLAIGALCAIAWALVENRIDMTCTDLLVCDAGEATQFIIYPQEPKPGTVITLLPHQVVVVGQDEPAIGDVTRVPDDVNYLFARRRFERMDGVL